MINCTVRQLFFSRGMGYFELFRLLYDVLNETPKGFSSDKVGVAFVWVFCCGCVHVHFQAYILQNGGPGDPFNV